MWLSNSLLKKIENLKTLGLELNLEQGAQIGRGFADLGYEQFVLLGERKMVSLFNGSKSEMPEGHERFFFSVPSIEEITNGILAKGWKIKSVIQNERREWCISALSSSGAEKSVVCSDLYEAFISMFTTVLGENGTNK